MKMIRSAMLAGALLCAGCLVVPAQTQKKGHPHGGPPGQMKAKHHGHGPECGHKRKKHQGVWVYSVDGRWYRAKGADWVVIVIDDDTPPPKKATKAKKAKKAKKK